MFNIFSKRKYAHSFDYAKSGVGHEILSTFDSEIVVACITGSQGIGDSDTVNEFCSHMAAAALHGDALGIAMSCFVDHSGAFGQELPIPVAKMDELSFSTFVDIVNAQFKNKLSNSVKNYLRVNGEEVKKIAFCLDGHAAWLMGAWYAFDNFEEVGNDVCMHERMTWYERSAHCGYVPAMWDIAQLFDNGDWKEREHSTLPTNLTKAAYWYRRSALAGNASSAYNLGVMYLHGDGVKVSRQSAALWLSLALNDCQDPLTNDRTLRFMKQAGIESLDNPDVHADPELKGETAELMGPYELLGVS